MTQVVLCGTINNVKRLIKIKCNKWLGVLNMLVILVFLSVIIIILGIVGGTVTALVGTTLSKSSDAALHIDDN